MQLNNNQQIWASTENNRPLVRNILKDRIVGASTFFTDAAVKRMVNTGNNQIFIASSNDQAMYLKELTLEACVRHKGIRFVFAKGDHIQVAGKRKLFFTSCTGQTFAALSGDVYIDEYMWMKNFHQVQYVAECIAHNKNYTETYYSTMNYASEGFYFWRGYKEEPDSQDDLPYLPDSELSNGFMCRDGQWRQVAAGEKAS